MRLFKRTSPGAARPNQPRNLQFDVTMHGDSSAAQHDSETVRIEDRIDW
jgi:hypothetical protein